MPVSPQDFALWSNLTGNPYPRTPAERMALAPEVFAFNRNLATGRNPVSQGENKLSNIIDTAGRWALGLGLLTGAGLLAGQYLGKKSGSGKTQGAQIDSGIAGELPSGQPSPPNGPEPTKPLSSIVSESPKPSPSEFLSAVTGPSSESAGILETVRSQQPYGYRSDRRMRNLVEGEPDIIEEAIYTPKLTRGELTGVAPTELTESSIRLVNPMIGGETYQPSGVSSNEISLALAKARAKITDKTVGKGLVTPRETPVSYTEAEKEAGYADIESYSPYDVGRQHGPVSARVSKYLEQSPISTGKLEVDNEPELAPTVIPEPHHAVSPTVAASGDITPPTTSDRYLQDVVPNQTLLAQQARGISPAKPTVVASEMKPATQSDVIASKQQFSPGSEIEQIGDVATERQRAEAFRKSAAYSVMQNKYEGLAPIQASTEPASAAPETLTNVQPSPQIKVAQPTDVGASLKAKGIYLSGDLESGTIQVNTENGGTFEINHPYATHPKRGIRETALREEQAARDVLQSAGVTPEQAKDYWSSKFSKPAESPVAAMAKPSQAPVTASVSAPAPGGASPAEIRELDVLLSRSHAGLAPEARVALRDQLLAQKGGGGARPIETPTQPAVVRVARETSEAPIEMPSPVSGPSPESVRFARETARGVSRMGLMAQKEAGRARTASRAQFGPEVEISATGESRELADPSALRAMMQRQSTIATPRYF